MIHSDQSFKGKYPSGPASLFATQARDIKPPIYEGQSCYVCGKQGGSLIFAGYIEKDFWKELRKDKNYEC